ncbi:sugar ABC transporter permease [Paenibacillus psychroresistens]|uniref:Sugar ABC transporter permease n=1 Tax=Paenibacillus psychroresistens TaxID=1778678 RepID=A0A6B8RF05_9BACL|nr:sugar ABC transporter permease [Paenibacillus psychroresistens]QGQ94135.1 sugar ABC transporter permease [Paenibacillus psychroresistens]
MRASKVKEEIKFYLFILPWIVGFFLLFVGPAIASLVYSFTDYNAVTANWIGLDNYKEMFHNPVFIKSLKNTLFFVVVGNPILICFQLLIALLLNIEVRGIRLFRTLYYLPYLVPPVATVIIWRLIFNETGAMNSLLHLVGLDSVSWFDSEFLSKPIILSMVIWGAGGTALIFIAALKGVPRHLYEAAKIDGSSIFRSFFVITLPMITPAILFALVIQIIYFFQIFTEPLLLNNKGAPNYSGTTYMVTTYRTAFTDFKFGSAMAQAWLLFGIILIITIIVLKTSKKWVYYESEKGS